MGVGIVVIVLLNMQEYLSLEWEWWYGSGDSGDCVVKHAGVIVTGMVIRVPPISYKTLLVCSTPL